MPLGSFPFRYLGAPLSYKKLSYVDCKVLVDKILARVRTWTVKHLSYAGRLVLVKSVLTSMQNFWCQLFLLPKKLLREVPSLDWRLRCKRALVAWEKLCTPRNAGGLNIRQLEFWNKESCYCQTSVGPLF